jgi:hypothetical protein
MSVEKKVAPHRSQETVKVAAPGRVQQARGNKEGDYKSAYGGKPPKRHKPTDGGKPGVGGVK